jgi:hypothetical protein
VSRLLLFDSLFDSTLDICCAGFGGIAFCFTAAVWIASGRLWAPALGIMLLVVGAIASPAISRLQARSCAPTTGTQSGPTVPSTAETDEMHQPHEEPAPPPAG